MPINLRKWITALALMAFSLPMFSAQADGRIQTRPAGAFVRIEAQSAARLASLDLHPLESIDYGAYLWLELSAEDLDALANADGVAYTPQPEAGLISVMGYRFDPVQEGEPDLTPGERMENPGPGLRLIQFSGPVKDEWLASLAKAGIKALQYYPNNAYLVWASDAQARQVETYAYVRWRGEFHPAYRLSPALESAGGRVENAAVTFYNDGQIEETLMAIQNLGGKYQGHFAAQADGRFQTALFNIDAGALKALAQIPVVWAIEPMSPKPGLDDEVGTQIVAGNLSSGVPVTGYSTWLAAKGVNGTNITWADVDTGLDGSHPDITGRVSAYVSYNGAVPADSDPDGHGSHTAGAIFGDPIDGTGITDPNGFYWGMGMAPAANLVVQNALYSATWPPLGGWQQLSKDTVVNGAIGSSNSWYTGVGGSQGYSSAARTHDMMVRDANFDTPNSQEPITMVFSAGNEGGNCANGPCAMSITEPKEAKNVIVVGASANYPRTMGSVNDIGYFSSRGPAQDGRVLPNVMAPGHSTVSFRSSDSSLSCSATPVSGSGAPYYSSCSGTSMAAPFVSGAAVLIADWWGDLGRGTPSPAMVKALLINAADDMAGGDDGWGNTIANVPNNDQGWGRVDLSNLIGAGLPATYYDQAQLFQGSGEVWSINLLVADPGQPVKISLVWSDAPGAVGANPALVNNLDLQVSSGGTTYLGNQFSAGWSVTGGSADLLNNIENVYVQNPGSGIQISITASAVGGDGVPGNADLTDQDFALVCSNCAETADFTLDVSPGNQAVCAPVGANYNVSLGQVLNFSDAVTLSTVITPAVSLTTSFDVNPVTPPGSSVLSIGNTGAVAAGAYTIEVLGNAPTSTHSAKVNMKLSSSVPGGVSLLGPLDGAVDQPVKPTFTWSPAAQADSYTIQIASDAGFTNIVETASGLTDPSYTPASDLATAQLFYWRVRGDNSCGSASFSSAFSFSTLPAPGQCSPGNEAITSYQEDFETGAPGWTYTGTGPNIWSLSGVRVHSGSQSFFAPDPNVVSDQRLVSPEVTLPDNLSDLVLRFWNYQQMENSDIGCYDGGVLEISTNGVTWTQLDAPRLLSDPYDGIVSATYANPLGGKNAWCGNPQDWLESIVDLDDYAGQTVQFRFRLGSDSSVGMEGWYIDDVALQGCHANYFASLDPSSDLSGVPGSSVEHRFRLRNYGQADAYTLQLSGASWPTQLTVASPVNVGSNSVVTVGVQVDIPAIALESVIGTDAFTLTATSVASPSLVLNALGTTTSAIHPGVNLNPATLSRAGDLGSQVSFNFNLTNSGDYTDTIGLALSGWSWPTNVSTDSVRLAPGEHVQVTVLVDIPTNPVSDAVIASDKFTLKATSGLDALVTAQAAGTTNAAITPGLEITPDLSDLIGAPGLVVTHTFRITNTGTFSDDFALAVGGNTWSISAPATSGWLNPGEASDLAVLVTIPGKIASEASLIQDGFDLTATSMWDSLVSAQVSGVTTAEAKSGVDLSASPQAGYAFPGESLIYQVTLTNTGEFSDTFDLSVSGAWTASLSSTHSGPLKVGESIMIQLSVSVPASANPGESETFTVSAASGNDPSVKTSVQVQAVAIAGRVHMPLIFHK